MMITTELALALAVAVLTFIVWRQDRLLKHLAFAHDRNATLLAVIMAAIISDEEEELLERLDDE